jgi:hypothetical protein
LLHSLAAWLLLACLLQVAASRSYSLLLLTSCCQMQGSSSRSSIWATTVHEIAHVREAVAHALCL